MTSRWQDHILGPDTHANLPPVGSAPVYSLYMCTTHNVIHRNSGAAWTDWATLVPLSRVINAQTGTTYTGVLTDANPGAFLTLSNASSVAFTVPPNSSVAYPVGSVIEGAQLGAGQVTITPGSGVTINGTPGLKVAAQYGTFGLLKTATDTWLAYGRLSA
ncbi:MAG: hypothetical protein J7518_20430 [Nocardioidaceae bacterium]|nr:hypothetical protein [Nocardioidaceae bacterium]